MAGRGDLPPWPFWRERTTFRILLLSVRELDAGCITDIEERTRVRARYCAGVTLLARADEVIE